MHRFWNQILRPLLDAAKPVTVLEIGSGQGECTRRLIDYCRSHRAGLTVVDPEPEWEISGWSFEGGEAIVHIAKPSLEILPQLPYHDVVFVDGDHSWYTVTEELRGLAAMASRAKRPFPVAVMHDVGWPYGRRDGYYVTERIPSQFLHPHSKKGMVYGMSELQDNGLVTPLFNAETEGGARNGVLTAVEDFLRETDLDLTWLYIEGIHGIGILVDSRTLADNADLRTFMAGLTLSDVAKQYVKGLEENRISFQLSSARFEKWAGDLHVYMEGFTPRLKDLEVVHAQTLGKLHTADGRVAELEAAMRRMKYSRSWRWTAWARRAEALLRGIFRA